MGRTTEELVTDITSRDTHKVWSAACEIISLGQSRESILPLAEYLPKIKRETAGLNLGGLFAPNQRFVDFAIRTIEFHTGSKDCPCTLYTEHEMFSPKNEREKGAIKICNTVTSDEFGVDYLVECLKCGREYKVTQREYHYTWWGWEAVSRAQNLDNI